jgi:lysophospholipase L1-like esterase
MTFLFLLLRPRALLFLALTLTAALSPLAHAAAPADLPRNPDDPIRWQARVDRYLTIRDKANPPPTGGVVFTGSSSIDMWTTLKADFPNLAVVNRGIGGTWLADQLHIAPQLVYPLDPKIIVLYAGENDLFADRTVADVITAYKAVREQIRGEAPQAHLVFLALKPSPSRDYLTAAMRDANDQIAALCAKDPRCTFVDVFTPMLDAAGNPRAELFIEDNLHMNAEGYRLWTSIVAPALQNLE